MVLACHSYTQTRKEIGKKLDRLFILRTCLYTGCLKNVYRGYVRRILSNLLDIDYIVNGERAMPMIGTIEETPSAANVPANWLRERRRRFFSREESTSTSGFSRTDFSRNYLTFRRYTFTYHHKGPPRPLGNRNYL